LSHGSWITYQLHVFNSEGSVASATIKHLYSVEPQAPSQGPVVLEVKASSITVEYIWGALDNGGSPLLSYHLQFADTFVGQWRDVNGQDIDSLLTVYQVTGLTLGREYSFRYRVRNVIGWSGYSPVTTQLVGVIPGRLQPPALLAVDASSIQLKLDTNVDDGGAVV
jgi:hypothetical protein